LVFLPIPSMDRRLHVSFPTFDSGSNGRIEDVRFQKTTKGGRTLKSNSPFKSMIITISGLPGSGTSTAAELLAQKTGMEIVSSGEVFRDMARDRGMSIEDFSDLAEENEEIDRKLDDRMLKKAKEGKILEGRLTGHLLDNSNDEAYKVWLEAPLEVRVKRITDREDEEIEEVKEKVEKREKSERKRYQDYYGIDLLDTSIYDLVLDSDKHGPEEIVKKIMEGASDEICKE